MAAKDDTIQIKDNVLKPFSECTLFSVENLVEKQSKFVVDDELDGAVIVYSVQLFVYCSHDGL